MVELADVLASGNIPIVDAESIREAGTAVVLLAVIEMLREGINLPEITEAEASLNSIFFNTDTDRVCWKSQGGTVLKFKLTL
jgi:hypothetical protein